jgi:hypothetical protein
VIDPATGLPWFAWLAGTRSFSRVVVAEPRGVGDYAAVELTAGDTMTFRAFPELFIVDGAPTATWYETDPLGDLVLRVAARTTDGAGRDREAGGVGAAANTDVGADPPTAWDSYTIADAPLPLDRFPEIVQSAPSRLSAYYRDAAASAEGGGAGDRSSVAPMTAAYRIDLAPGARPQRIATDPGTAPSEGRVVSEPRPAHTAAGDAVGGWWIGWIEHDTADESDAYRLVRESPAGGAMIGERSGDANVETVLRLRIAPDPVGGALLQTPALAIRDGIAHLFWIERREFGGDEGLYHQAIALPE